MFNDYIYDILIPLDLQAEKTFFSLSLLLLLYLSVRGDLEANSASNES